MRRTLSKIIQGAVGFFKIRNDNPAGPRLWNTLPEDITSAPSLLVRVPTKTEDSFVSAILSGHCIVACVACCARWSLKFLLRPPLKNCNVM